MDRVVEFTEEIVKGLVKNPDIVKVQGFTDEDNVVMLEIIVHSDDIGAVIGKSGNMAKAIRTRFIPIINGRLSISSIQIL